MSSTLLKFASRAEAVALIGGDFERRTALNVGGDNEESIRVITTEAVYEGDPTTLVSPEVLASGFFCWLWGVPVPPELQIYADAAAVAAEGARVEPTVIGC